MSDSAPAVQSSTELTDTAAIRVAVKDPPRVRTRARRVEAWLLLFALLIVAFSITLVELGALGSLNVQIFVLMLPLSVLVIGYHILLRIFASNADPIMLPTATLINGIGIAFLYRIDIARDLSGWSSLSVRQVAWTAISLIASAIVLVAIRSHRPLQRYTYIFGLLAVLLLLSPLIPGIGVEVSGARLWLQIGPFSIQPGEFAKIALAIFFAGYLVARRDSLSVVGKKVLGFTFPRLRDTGPILVFWALSMLILVSQRDLGTSLLYFGLFLVMIYVATNRSSWIVIGLVLFAAGALIASRLFSYVGDRIGAWLHPFDSQWYDAWGGSYQLVQGLFGFAAGGFIGTGLGQGMPNLTPKVENDFIFSGLGEELGLVGVFALLCMYLILVSRGLRIGFTGQDDFGRLLAVGLSFTIALQCFIVIGGITRVIPMTGLTTPFLAAGGSSLMANWIIIGILLRISDSVRSEAREVAERE
ncbi:MAG TPA: FtsW/RodA/SpoVE family cell cycle protein [Pseudoclavibacter sp.]|nr:FtsW/RodA/SpoVE family cell cycle protein [Pseudoclavibacter sp.]